MTSILSASVPEFVPSTRPTTFEQQSRVRHGLRKTELCKFFAMNKCPRSRETCAFAHGKDDLRPDAFELRCKLGSILCGRLYKTQSCFSWESTGACKYGVRCCFFHDPKLAADAMCLHDADVEDAMVTKRINSTRCTDRFSNSSCSRLEVFRMIAP